LGKIIHQACEGFISEGGKGELEDLLEKGRRLLAPYQNRPGLLTFWWPRFCQIAAWFVEHEAKRRAENPFLKSLTEVRGKLLMIYGGEEFLLTARADRIDLFEGGKAEIIDYKTGHLPTDNEIEQGFAPQLPLEGAILLAGGFDFVPRPCHLEKLSYWGLYGRHRDLEKSLKGDPETLSKKALSDLEGFLRIFHNPHFPYLSQPFASQAPLYSDYDHLARIQAWRDS
jgi:ATP-dependent helicase/nuclease subunit B